MTISYSIHATPFGLCLIANTDKGICNVLFGDTEKVLVAELRNRRKGVALQEKQEMIHDTVLQYLAGNTAPEAIVLDLHGTDFQQKVWQALCTIPSGTTTTYSAVAEMIGIPAAVRAVGTAIGSNPVGYVVPCHRVIRGDGGLGGYAWGVARKQQMLDYEALLKKR